jgi:hypothetical protein
MANHVYSITDGVTTLTLTSSPYIVERYEMRAAKTDGNGVYGTSVETILLTVTGATAAAAQASFEALELMINEIARRKTRPNEQKCYIQAQLISDASMWRSQLLDAMIEPRDEALSVWNGATIPCTVKIERKHFWEGTQTSVSISNTHGSGTSGVSFYQCNDATHDNYANIGSGSVTGTLPAPCEVRIKNSTGAQQNWRRYFLWVNAFSSPTTFPYTIEGEAEAESGVTTTVDATASNGNVGRFTVNTNALLRYTLSSTMLASSAGRDFRIITRIPYMGGPCWVKVELHTIDIGNPIASTREIRIEDDGSAIKDLGAIALPPGGYSINWDSHILVLRFRSESSVTVDIDYIMVASTDSFIQVDQPSWVIEINEYIHIDTINNQVFSRNASVKDFPILVKLDNELNLFPGRANRIHLLVDGLSDTTLWLTTVYLTYKPRRLTI